MVWELTAMIVANMGPGLNILVAIPTAPVSPTIIATIALVRFMVRTA